jgi:hypothetical protein
MKDYHSIGGTAENPTTVFYHGEQVIQIPLTQKEALRLTAAYAQAALTAPERIEDGAD